MYNYRKTEIKTEALENEEFEQQARQHMRVWSQIFDFAGSMIMALALITVIFTFCFRPVRVQGPSMENTLFENDWLLVTAKENYSRGDIIIATQPNDLDVPIVKRVIAFGGEMIDINFETGDVSVNGEVIEEDYIKEKTSLRYDVTFPYRVPDGELFVMGDNRNDSLDSRSTKIGTIDTRYVLGKAFVKAMPVSDFKFYGF